MSDGVDTGFQPVATNMIVFYPKNHTVAQSTRERPCLKVPPAPAPQCLHARRPSTAPTLRCRPSMFTAPREAPFFLYCSFCRWDSAQVDIMFEKPTGLAGASFVLTFLCRCSIYACCYNAFAHGILLQPSPFDVVQRRSPLHARRYLVVLTLVSNWLQTRPSSTPRTTPQHYQPSRVSKRGQKTRRVRRRRLNKGAFRRALTLNTRRRGSLNPPHQRSHPPYLCSSRPTPPPRTTTPHQSISTQAPSSL
jgi:hypothetical protein